MRPALHLGDDRGHFVFGQIDHCDERSCGTESERDFAPNPPGSASDQNALAIKA